jgi:hypothetical protein
MTDPVRGEIGPFRLEWSPGKDARHGISVLYKGRKVRISFYEDGRVRFRIDDAAPMIVQECYLTGNKDDVLITVAPQGWNQPPAPAKKDGGEPCTT